MEISLRMWVFIFFGVLIAGILIEGIRRWVREKNNPYRLALGTVKLDPSKDDPIRHEIGGPARPVDPARLEPLINEDALTAEQTEIEAVELKPDMEARKQSKTESFFARHTKPKVTDTEKPEKTEKPQKKKPKAEKLDLTTHVPMLTDVAASENDGVENTEISEESTEQFDILEKTEPLFTEQESAASASTADEEEIQEAIVLNVFSRDAKGFQGEALLEVLLGCSLRYGDMSIFHRHQSPVGEGKVLFSVANAMNPGTFKIEAMNKFSTKGLSFFFGLPGPAKPIETFDLMLQTAQFLAKRLNGELKDDKRNVLTVQTIEHYRQRIRDFERRHLAQ